VKLSLDEVKKEAEFIASSGLRHILVLTGESRKESPVDYIRDCVKILKEYFDSISVEMYPLETEEYLQLVQEGVEGLTIYQEVYDEDIYSRLHPVGPKANYRYRLDAPEKGAIAGMRNVNIGTLLGLNDWRKETFLMILHAQYLQNKFPEVEVGVSIPRIRPQVANFKPSCTVSDRDLVQIILALRIYLPRSQIALSTRERQDLRDNLIPLGITRISAGSSTAVGGHVINNDDQIEACQFDISDKRSIEEMKSVLNKIGYQGVLKDWERV
jgi:2-iminoacetate synthase